MRNKTIHKVFILIFIIAIFSIGIANISTTRKFIIKEAEELEIKERITADNEGSLFFRKDKAEAVYNISWISDEGIDAITGVGNYYLKASVGSVKDNKNGYLDSSRYLVNIVRKVDSGEDNTPYIALNAPMDYIVTITAKDKQVKNKDLTFILIIEIVK